MYWYYKYPLYAILLLVLLGIGSWIWRSCSSTKTPRAPEAGVVAPVENGNSTGGTVTPSGTTTAPAPAPKGSPATVPPTGGNGPTLPGGSAVLPEEGDVTSPYVDPRLEKLLEMSDKQFQVGRLEAARFLAQKVLKDSTVREFSHYWRKAAERINAVNAKVMNSTAPITEKKGYRVVSGDSLARVARRHHTNVGALLRINENLRRDDGRDPIIRPTQTILYISGKWSIRVSKQHFLLILYFNDELYRIYTVGIGRDNRTPAGEFLITSTLSEPAWTPPGKNIPFGDPENVLGTRWLKLTPTDGTDPTLEGYGIHGTWQPDSVGTSCSAGCVRMRNTEVEELFDFIPVPGDRTPPVRVSIQE